MANLPAKPIPPPKPLPQIEAKYFSGTREEITRAIMECHFPQSWGDRDAIRKFAYWHVPQGNGWRGLITVTGYRTPANENGDGTAYVSVRWKPDTR